MIKKIFLVFTLAAIISGAAFAQNHWISAEASVLGGSVRYELMLFKELSVGINAYYNVNVLLEKVDTDFGADFSIRFYPFSGVFFVGLGVGYHNKIRNYLVNVLSGGEERFLVTGNDGIGITPEIGWKIDVGKQGAFFIQPGIKVPISFVTNQIRHNGSINQGHTENYTEVGLIPYFGIGYAF